VNTITPVDCMKDMKKKIMQAVVTLIFAAAPFAAGAQDGYNVVFVVGEVSITAGGKTHKAVVNESLTEGALIATGSGSMADISLAGKGLMRARVGQPVAHA